MRVPGAVSTLRVRYTGSVISKADGERPVAERGPARILRVLRNVLYGMVLHDMVRLQTRNRAGLEHLFILITMGDLVGVPVLPPYYSLRLLPYVVPELEGWKRRLLRKKDIVDIFG